MGTALERFLRAGRHELNARFAEGRLRHPDLDPEAFRAFLHDAVDPLVAAIDRIAPARTAEVAESAFDLALEIVGQRLGAVDDGAHGIVDGWRRVLALAPEPVATSSRRVLTAITNAAHQLATTPQVRAGQWIDDMSRLAPRCPDPDTLLRTGQVAAWRAGMAHYRAGALAAAQLLPESLALEAVGAPPSARWSEIASKLATSPWFDPADPATATAYPRVVSTPGDFRGFGGHFVEPPRVAVSGDSFHLFSGGEQWLMTADRFGATFHRARADESEALAPADALPAGLRKRTKGIEWSGETLAVVPRGEITSAAATATTLALTWSHSHRVTLVALA